jgi:hypothetical protein
MQDIIKEFEYSFENDSDPEEQNEDSWLVTSDDRTLKTPLLSNWAKF